MENLSYWKGFVHKKGWERVIELSAHAAGKHKIGKMCIEHVNAQQMAQQFEEEIRIRLHCPK